MPFNGVLPAARFKTNPYGLFSVADVTKHVGGDEHWVGGFNVDNELCTVEGTIIDICGGDGLEFVSPTGEAVLEKIRPFAIRASNSCLALGAQAVDQRAKIMRQLDSITQMGVEAELWSGAYARELDTGDGTPNMFLASDGASDVTGGAPDTPGTAIKAKTGVALLEQALAQCGGGNQGVIHVPPSVASVLGGDVEEGNGSGAGKHLVTNAGNLISVGAGYDGRGPGETTAPADFFTPWIYATGPVAVHLGPPELVTSEFNQAVNPSTNEMTFVAVRPAVAYWDGCCHFAVQVDIRL